jgi:hypothetical protein
MAMAVKERTYPISSLFSNERRILLYLLVGLLYPSNPYLTAHRIDLWIYRMVECVTTSLREHDWKSSAVPVTK